MVALTNNFDIGENDEIPQVPPELAEMFDDFIESRVVGMRKPDPKIFQYALDRMGMRPEQVAFLDDIGMCVIPFLRICCIDLWK